MERPNPIVIEDLPEFAGVSVDLLVQLRLAESTSKSLPRAFWTRSRRELTINDETVVKNITGAATDIRAPLAATNGAAATIPVGPMTADPTPAPMVRVAALSRIVG